MIFKSSHQSIETTIKLFVFFNCIAFYLLTPNQKKLTYPQSISHLFGNNIALDCRGFKKWHQKIPILRVDKIASLSHNDITQLYAVSSVA